MDWRENGELLMRKNIDKRKKLVLGLDKLFIKN